MKISEQKMDKKKTQKNEKKDIITIVEQLKIQTLSLLIYKFNKRKKLIKNLSHNAINKISTEQENCQIF